MNPNKIICDILVNVLLSLLKAAALLGVISLTTEAMTPAALGMFLLARRAALTLANFLQLGMSQALIRYIAIHSSQRLAKQTFMIFAVFVVTTTSAILFLLAFIFGKDLGQWLLPQAENGKDAIFWSSLIVIGTMFHYIATSSYVAERRLYVANFLALMNVSGILFIVLIWYDQHLNLENALQGLGIGSMIFGAFAIATYLASNLSIPLISNLHWTKAKREFVGYGIPRGVIAFLDMSMLIIGPWLLREDPESSGYLLLAFMMIRVLISAIMPATQVLSVITAQWVGVGKEEQISRSVRLLFGILLYAVLLVLAFVAPWAKDLLGLWLPDNSVVSGVWSFISVIGLSILPATFFYGLRGVIETRWRRPRNLFTIIAALAVHILLFLLLRPVMGIEEAVKYSVVAMFSVLGLMTFWWTRKDILCRHFFGIGTLVLLSILFVLSSILFQGFFGLEGMFLALAIDVGMGALIFRILGIPPVLSQTLGILTRK